MLCNSLCHCIRHLIVIDRSVRHWSFLLNSQVQRDALTLVPGACPIC
jgi:hypothetical protein